MISSTVTGSGPPLVLVHGTTADHTRWRPILPALEAKFTVHAIDRRGRGGSDDDGDYAIEREFEDVARVCDAIGGPVDLLGHSYGAICSMEASLRAKSLRKLVLYEPPIGTGRLPDEFLASIDALIAAGDRDGAVTRWFTEVVRVPPSELAKLRGLPAWQRRVAAVHTVTREARAATDYVLDATRFAAMRTPTLLLVGGDSPAYFQRGVELAHAALPDARVVVLPGQQHAAIDTAPELFAREVLAFLAG